mmetsp:Transcript_32359/g.78726  ORF Transcript_32359/g.78726 Transcript_32359/m.78726 type:complete len:420 (+) Transcript_32359:207-1466(+)
MSKHLTRLQYSSISLRRFKGLGRPVTNVKTKNKVHSLLAPLLIGRRLPILQITSYPFHPQYGIVFLAGSNRRIAWRSRIHLMLLIRIGELELRSSSHSHDGVEDTELTGSQGTNHDAPSSKTGEAEFDKTHLVSETAKTGHNGSFSTSSLLVDQRKQSVCRVGDDGRSHTSNYTGGEGNSKLCALARSVRVNSSGGPDFLSRSTLHSELCHCVRNLLKENRSESGVETNDETIIPNNLRHSRNKAAGVFGVGDEADTSGLKRAKEDVSNKFSASGSSQVDGDTHLPCLLLTQFPGKVDFEELNTAKLEPSLNEVSNDGRAKTGGERPDTLRGNNLSETGDHTTVVLLRFELDAGLHDINGAEGSMGNGTAETPGEGTFKIVGEIERALRLLPVGPGPHRGGEERGEGHGRVMLSGGKGE